VPRFPRAELAVVLTAAGLVFSRVFGLAVVMPGFRGHYAAAFPVDALWIGLAFGAHGLTMALMQLPLGILSDRVGRRPVLLAASVLFVAGSAWAAFADSIAALIAARLVQGLGAVASVSMAMVGETVPESRRTTAMALVGIPAGMGFFLGVFAAPLLVPLVGVPGLFLVAAGVGLAAAAPLLAIRPAPAEAPSPVPARASLGLPVMSLALGGFTLNFALTSVMFFLPDASAGRLLPPLGLALVAMLLASRQIDRRSWTWQPLAAGLVGLAAAAPAYLLLDGGAAAFAAGTAFFACHAILSAAFPSQVSRVAGRSGGRGHGIQNIVAYLGTFAGGAVAGAFASRPSMDLVVLAGLAVACAALLVAGLRTARPQPTPTGA